ncbi:MAG: DUF4190 domain-containing protein [Microbacteriaceae bacterium]|nr:DUF4190 domain-containing protein [Microbacteriaceae bacterium]
MTDAPPPAYSAAPAAPINPGKTMGIIALVLSILPFQLIGIILGFVALGQSKKAGQKNGFALAAIIIGFIGLVLFLIFIVAGGALFGSLFGGLTQVCSELGSGVWEIDGVTYTCP